MLATGPKTLASVSTRNDNGARPNASKIVEQIKLFRSVLEHNRELSGKHKIDQCQFNSVVNFQLRNVIPDAAQPTNVENIITFTIESMLMR